MGKKWAFYYILQDEVKYPKGKKLSLKKTKLIILVIFQNI